LTLTRPWSNIGTAHRLIILDICAKLFVNPTRGSKDIERTRKCHFMGGDIMIIESLKYAVKQIIFNQITHKA